MHPVEVWRAFIDGDLVLVETFEHEGRRIMVGKRSAASAERSPLLTAREEAVLALRARALDLKSIARELSISEPTVSIALAKGRKKLGIANDAELVSCFSGGMR